MDNLDQIVVGDLLLRGIVGINPEERKNKQDIVVNVTMWADTRLPGKTDNVDDTVNYRTVSKAIIKHVEEGKPLLVERLAAELVQICFETDERIQAVELSVEKPGAIRFARTVGLKIYRTRDEVIGDESDGR